MTTKLTLPRLKKIIAEEMARAISEEVDHASIRDVVNVASKLLAAVEAFEKGANGSMKSAVTPHLDKIEVTLEDMVSTPGSYVDKKKTAPQHVSLKPAKGKIILAETYTGCLQDLV